ncbi:hypothetical protein ACP275_14G091000 [Erythranthe tilingii]
MARSKEKEDADGRFSAPVSISMADSSISMLKLISILIVFVVGMVIGLVSSSNINKYFTFQGDQFDFKSHYFDTEQFSHDAEKKGANCEKGDCLSMESFIRPKSLTHRMTDDELFWRASLVPEKEDFPFKRVPRVAFMFLTRGPLPLLPLWERFFSGQDKEKYSIYVHAPGFELNVADSSVFHRRQIPSQNVQWGSVSLVDAEKRLLANALLDFSNERFVLLSERCIPIYNFATVYKYLTESLHSFIDSYDDPSRYGRGRYNRRMQPDIRLAEWRKGSQWFEAHRTLAVKIVADFKYYSIFRKYCRPSCYPDEHYIPTYVRKFYGALNSNRSLTYVDWSMMGPHPATFTAVNITTQFLQLLRNNGTMCSYNSETTNICYLFARKFDESALEPLLSISSQVMGF